MPAHSEKDNEASQTVDAPNIPAIPADISFENKPSTVESLGLNETTICKSEKAAHERLKVYLSGAAEHYAVNRDWLDITGSK